MNKNIIYMFVAPDPNYKVYGPPVNQQDIWISQYWYRPVIRKDKIKKIFNVVRKEK